MALSPFVNKNTIDRIKQVKTNSSPTLTYEYDFDRQEFTGQLIDKEAAFIQFVRKVLATARFRHLIYTSAYGQEIEDLMGEDVTSAFLSSEIPRLIREALIYDARVKNVSEFSISKESSSDQVFTRFKVESVDAFTVGVEYTLSEDYSTVKSWKLLNGDWNDLPYGSTWDNIYNIEGW